MGVEWAWNGRGMGRLAAFERREIGVGADMGIRFA